MIKIVSKYLFHLIFLALFQIFVFNNVILFNSVHVYPYIFFLLMMPLSINKNLLLVIAFISGLLVDVFSSSYGMHASASVLIAFIRPFLINQFIAVEDSEKTNIQPSLSSLGMWPFLQYIFVFTFIQIFYLHILETAGFSDFFFTLYKSILSTIFTVLLIAVYEFAFFFRR